MPPPHTHTQVPCLLCWREAGPRWDSGAAAVTHLHDVFLEDPIETQLTHGVDRLPLLGFLRSHQQIGDFCGRERRSLSQVNKGPRFPSASVCRARGLAEHILVHLLILSCNKYLLSTSFLPSRSSQANHRAKPNQILNQPKGSYNSCNCSEDRPECCGLTQQDLSQEEVRRFPQHLLLYLHSPAE